MKRNSHAWRIAAALLLLVASAVLQVRASGTAAQDSKPEVAIDNFSFTPTTLTVAAGTTVAWTNHDDVPHTVVAEDKSFKSRALDTDEGFRYTFSKAGTYKYFCSLHPKMTATVVVR